MLNSKTCSVVGIDHGTTNCCVAVYRNDRIDVAVNNEGQRTTPSMAAYLEDGGTLVGAAAQNRIGAGNVLFDMKRLLGKSGSDPVVTRLKQSIECIVSNKQEDGSSPVFIETKLSGQPVVRRRPLEVCSLFFAKMRETSERALSSNSREPVAVKKCVLAVPAHFTQIQKAESVEAARLGGLEVLEVIPEPVAAAYAYGFDSGRYSNYRILVFDLGGGTFDATIIQVTNGKFEVLEMGGDANLGGRDFDATLRRWASAEIQREHGVNCKSSSRLFRQLLMKCEEAKKSLSFQTSTSMFLGDMHRNLAGAVPELPITREKFVELCGPSIQHTIGITADLLKAAKLQPKQIDEVLLSGGSSRVPLVQEKLLELFPHIKQLNRSINEDEVVAYGAAVRAAQLCKRVSGCMPKMTIVQKTALTLGVDSVEGTFEEIVPRMSRVPGNWSKTFSTVVNDQTSMDFRIYEGERKMSADNIYLGTVAIDDIKKDMATRSIVEVVFALDKSGLLTVTARHDGKTVVEKLDYSNSPAVTCSTTVEKMLQEAKNHARKDKSSQAKGLALNALKIAVEKEEYAIPPDEAKRSATQSERAGVCKHYRQWIEENGEKKSEKEFCAKRAKFEEECERIK